MVPVSRSPFFNVTWSALAIAAETHNNPANNKLRRTFVLLEAFPRQVGWPGLAGTALAASIGCVWDVRRTQATGKSCASCILFRLGVGMTKRPPMVGWVWTLAILSLVSVGCSRQVAPSSAQSQSSAANPATIVFMTDFGTANDAVAICRAVIYGIAPGVRITDITHQVTPYSIEEASRFLFGVTPYYPPGTVFLVVVDPGVGTSRKAIAVKSKKGQYFILPDNGVISAVLERDGLESAREIANREWMILAPVSSTFHGRDIFSPSAAHLAAGWDFNLIGPVVPQLVRLSPKASTATDRGITGEII